MLKFSLEKKSIPMSESGGKNTRDYNDKLTFQNWSSVTHIHLTCLL